MEAGQQGLVIYRASRLEALLDPLLILMQASPPQHVLAPHSLIAAHPGMRKWLSRELALRRGPRGIAANLQIELPSAWLDRLALHVLGEEAVALRPYRREVLRWRVHACLDDIDDAQVRAYLGGEASSLARRQFQLADRLARIYTRYLVYRPDWLADWAAGRQGSPPGGFLAPLWKTLREQIGLPHRGELLSRLVPALARTPEGPLGDEPLHVFGVAHLAPSELAVLRAVARRRPVILYVPDPCREFWGGLRDERSRLRDLLEHDPGSQATESAFLQQEHPLLGSWGRMGQHFMLALEDAGAAVDDRHWKDRDAPVLDTRLQRVQESIRQLVPALIGERDDARIDRSLRVHACHTRLRELEVLRDALLLERKRDPHLKPSDIVVMMPDIQAYLPLLPSVFGEAGRHEGPLPYHCADVAVARAHPLFEAFRRLLDLPLSRLTAPEVVDLLTVPQIAQRLNLARDDIDVLAGWLGNSRVAWGLDGAFRARFDVPPIQAHTFSWAMDRLLAGYVMGQAEGGEAVAVVLPDGSEVAPLDGIHGPQSALVGALDRLLVELADWCADSQAQLKASEWAERLEKRIESVFRVDPLDPEAREAKQLLLQIIRALASEPRESGLDPLLDFSVVRELLLARIDAVPERQRFLMGGATFCGMVPQRAIPFKVVAVLGLNDGEFPRGSSDGGLDLMGRYRRMGDRDVRSDDRYLFLETLMSARKVLHLSYIGQGVRDGKPRNPAAPLAELMAALDGAARTTGAGNQNSDGKEDDGDKEKRARPWLVRHPLQPFDARYFDQSDPALFSFRGDLAGMRSPHGTEPALQSFVDSRAATEIAPASAPPVPLREVLAYYKDPARQLLADGLNLRLGALDDDRLRESEPLEAKFEALDQVARRLFIEAAQRGDSALPDAAPDWLRLTGMLPPGRIGACAWVEEKAKVEALLAAVHSPAHAGHSLFASGLPSSQPVLIDRLVDGVRVQGEVREVYDSAGARWIMQAYPGRKEEQLDFKTRIGFFLMWALVRLDASQRSRAVRACVVVSDKKDGWGERFNDWDAVYMDALDKGDRAAAQELLDDLERRVAGLLAFWRQSQGQPQWYFPATSWVAAGGEMDAVISKWMGGARGHGGERDYAPGYARLLAGERDFSDEADYALLHANAVRLHGLIDLTSTTERLA